MTTTQVALRIRLRLRLRRLRCLPKTASVSSLSASFLCCSLQLLLGFLGGPSATATSIRLLLRASSTGVHTLLQPCGSVLQWCDACHLLNLSFSSQDHRGRHRETRKDAHDRHHNALACVRSCAQCVHLQCGGATFALAGCGGAAFALADCGCAAFALADSGGAAFALADSGGAAFALADSGGCIPSPTGGGAAFGCDSGGAHSRSPLWRLHSRSPTVVRCIRARRSGALHSLADSGVAHLQVCVHLECVYICTVAALHSRSPAVAALHSHSPAVAALHSRSRTVVALHSRSPTVVTLHSRSPTVVALHLRSPSVAALQLCSPTFVALHLRSPTVLALHLRADSCGAAAVLSGSTCSGVAFELNQTFIK